MMKSCGDVMKGRCGPPGLAQRVTEGQHTNEGKIPSETEEGCTDSSAWGCLCVFVCVSVQFV